MLRHAALAALALAACGGGAAAQNPQSTLPQRVTDLERRVAALEKKILPQSTLPPRASDPWARPDGMKAKYSPEDHYGCKAGCGCTTTGGYYVCPGQLTGTRCPCARETPAPVVVAAPAVAAPAPFVLPARSTTPGTIVLTADGPSMYRLVPAQSAGLTSTAAPRGTSGITSGCANGACAAATSYGRPGLFGRWR